MSMSSSTCFEGGFPGGEEAPERMFSKQTSKAESEWEVKA